MDTITAAAPQKLIGVGLYTAAEASGLTGIPLLRIRRWLTGYARGPNGAQGWSDPLWTPQLPRTGKDVALGFRDLMELKFVASFIAAGITLHSIRRAQVFCRHIIGDERPFSTTRFRTDAWTTLLQEPALIDLRNRKSALNRVVGFSFRDIDFGETAAERWWPMSRRSGVVVDPARNFGHPIVAEHGVPTQAIADAVTAEGSVAKVAKLFELPISAVRDALAFERRAA